MSDKIYIDGNTYPVKDQLKRLGCRWDAGRKAWYTDSAEVGAKAKAIVSPHPIYNSPPPADLGTADPVELAAQFDRKAVSGAKVTSWTVYGLGKGDDGEANGTIRKIKGKRYVQVARTARRYLSRDWLEDMDLFDAEAGGSYQWDGVEIEPTPDELAADATASTAKAEKEAAPKLLGDLLGRIATEVTERPSWVSDSTCVATWIKPAMVHTASYATLHVGASEVYYHVPSYFACDWDYEAVHRVAPLTADLRSEITTAVAAGEKHGLLKI